MSNDFTPDADDQMPEKKSSQQLLLLLLLLLVVLFAYLYFFTGLIKPRGEEPKPQPVAEAPVKKPLPPRTNVAKGAVPAKPVAKAEEHKVAPPAVSPAPAAKPGAVAKVAPAAKPAPTAKETAAAKPGAAAKEAPVAKSAVATPGKSATQAAQAKAAKPATPVPQAKGSQPAVAPATQAKAPAASEKKGAATAEKRGAPKSAATAKTAAKEAAGAKAPAGEAGTVAAPKKPKAPVAAYTLEINGDLAESELAPVMAKLKQAGITHVVKSKQLKGEPMHRLYLADFASRDEALEELERLKLATADAFLLKENGRYAVYAGSYLREAKANSEQSRLQAKGVQLLLKSATAPVSVLRVRAGAFANEAGAERAAKALKKSGLSLKVVKLAKAGK